MHKDKNQAGKERSRYKVEGAYIFIAFVKRSFLLTL